MEYVALISCIYLFYKANDIFIRNESKSSICTNKTEKFLISISTIILICALIILKTEGSN